MWKRYAIPFVDRMTNFARKWSKNQIEQIPNYSKMLSSGLSSLSLSLSLQKDRHPHTTNKILSTSLNRGQNLVTSPSPFCEPFSHALLQRQCKIHKAANTGEDSRVDRLMIALSCTRATSPQKSPIHHNCTKRRTSRQHYHIGLISSSRVSTLDQLARWARWSVHIWSR